MKSKLLMTIMLSGLLATCFAQQNKTWNKWQWLLGSWQGNGSGEPGKGGGTFSFALDLNEKVLIRKSHAEYTASENKPAITHDDLMIIYPDYSGNPAKAIYFDNEGHIINYSIMYDDKSIVFTSGRIPDVPVFRLTYSLLENETINTKFEISQDGDKFTTYIEGISKKIRKRKN